MVVLGIDPGTASTGFGVVKGNRQGLVALDGGVISTSPKQPTEKRLMKIHQMVARLIEEHSPAEIAVEDIFFGSNVETAFAVGQARGVVLLAAGFAGIPSFTYTPQAVKKSVCGSGRADKHQVQRMVKVLLSLDSTPRPDHASDALAVAICHAHRGGALAQTARAEETMGAIS